MSQKRKFKVIALSVSGLSNRIYQLNEIVAEDAWEEGRADELAKAGFLEEFTDKTTSHTVTTEDLNNDYQLAAAGIKEGDKIEIAAEVKSGEKETEPKSKATTKK